MHGARCAKSPGTNAHPMPSATAIPQMTNTRFGSFSIISKEIDQSENTFFVVACPPICGICIGDFA